MSEPPPDSLIPYDEIVQEALRAVVGRVLGEIEVTGRLPGEHHFYITFKTGAAGVDIPRHLTERFPDEMTIVIQNRFWDLRVREDGFEVGLSFNQAPAKLYIPSPPSPASSIRRSASSSSSRPSPTRRIWTITTRRRTTRRWPSRSRTGRTSSRWISSGRNSSPAPL